MGFLLQIIAYCLCIYHTVVMKQSDDRAEYVNQKLFSQTSYKSRWLQQYLILLLSDFMMLNIQQYVFGALGQEQPLDNQGQSSEPAAMFSFVSSSTSYTIRLVSWQVVVLNLRSILCNQSIQLVVLILIQIQARFLPQSFAVHLPKVWILHSLLTFSNSLKHLTVQLLTSAGPLF